MNNLKLTLKEGKLVSQDGIEVENWQDFFSIERDGLWRKTKGGGFEKMRGETIDLPEGIEAEVLYQYKNKYGYWRKCDSEFGGRYTDVAVRQIIRLKPVVDAVEHKTQDRLKKETMLEAFQRVLDGMSDEELERQFTELGDIGAKGPTIDEYCNFLQSHYKTANTDTQESQYTELEVRLLINRCINTYAGHLASNGCDVTPFDEFNINEWMDENVTRKA
jgi:hypothetical protein